MRGVVDTPEVEYPVRPVLETPVAGLPVLPVVEAPEKLPELRVVVFIVALLSTLVFVL